MFAILFCFAYEKVITKAIYKVNYFVLVMGG